MLFRSVSQSRYGCSEGFKVSGSVIGGVMFSGMFGGGVVCVVVLDILVIMYLLIL